MEQTFTPADYESASVTLSRGPCFGPCPVYDVTVQANGTVFYHGSWWVKTTGAKKQLISPEIAQLLISTFIIHDFFSLRDIYSYEDCMITDLAMMKTTLKIGMVTKTVSRYGDPPTAPKILYFLEDEIDRVSNSIQWVGNSGEVEA